MPCRANLSLATVVARGLAHPPYSAPSASADCNPTLSADQLPARYVPPNHPGRPYSDLPEMMMRWRSRQCLQNGMAHPTPMASGQSAVLPACGGRTNTKGIKMPDHAANFIYRPLPHMPMLRCQQRSLSLRGIASRFGFVRLTATHCHRAATALIDWERAVDAGWPRLQSPTSPLLKRFRRSSGTRYAGFPRFTGILG